MRGLTDYEHDVLVDQASGPLQPLAGAPDEVLRRETLRLLQARGCVQASVAKVEGFGWGKLYGITALGRLALSLWPAIRSGQ
jgi:hypothetical protein